MINYVDAAKANGWRADWVRGDQLADRMAEVSGFDVLVIWRMPWNADLEEAIAMMRSCGRRLRSIATTS